MRDIRLEELPFEFEGKTYLLRCNMNVLADVQEAFGGSILGALSGDSPNRGVLEFIAAMMNDYADEQGWPERYTAKTLGRRVRPKDLPIRDAMALVTRAVSPDPTPDGETVSGTDTGEDKADNSGN